jgi:hypothetical protein
MQCTYYLPEMYDVNFLDVIEKFLEVFMDDFSIFGSSFDNCLRNLSLVLKRCKETNLILSWEKSYFMVQEGIVLGHIVSMRGIEVDRAKVELKLLLRACRVLSTLHQGLQQDLKAFVQFAGQGHSIPIR